MSANHKISVRTAPIAEPAKVMLLLRGSVENLLRTWDQKRGLFPFSSRRERGTITNDYSDRIAIRYTINSLLGLTEAARSGTLGVTTADVEAMTRRFYTAAPGRITLPADHGLDTVLQVAQGADAATLRSNVARLGRLVREADAALNMQDLAWILWGASRAYRAGVEEAGDVARSAQDYIELHLVDSGTGLPRHNRRYYRRDVVSFGSLTYFLRGMHEVGEALGDERARDRFDAGVARAIGLQGPLGEWPWMINSRTGLPFDFYPVFAVHQDSMAMLFLLPAADRGLAGAPEAIQHSLDWVFGRNERSLRMFEHEPLFFAYRSLERAEHAPRVARYARSFVHRVLPRAATPSAPRIRLNDECRSYHLGWILYVWSNRLEALTAEGER